MLLSDAAAEVPAAMRLTVFGTDVDEAALDLARAGRYPAHAALDMDREWHARYTSEDGQTIRVSEALRHACSFSRRSLLHDQPMARMDLIVCHRIFDGIPPRRRGELIERLHFALRKGGSLLAVDHVEAYAGALFERVGPRHLVACAVTKPSTASRMLTTRRGADGRAALAFAQANVRLTSGEVTAPSSGARPARRGIGRFVPTLGVPLVLCDSNLQVIYTTPEVTSAWGVSGTGRGSALDAISGQLPGGAELVSAARRALLGGGATHDVVVRDAARVLLARVCAASAGGVSILFTEVTPVEGTATRESREHARLAVLARLDSFARSAAAMGAVHDGALDAALENVRGCSAGVLMVRAPGTGELEIVASRGLGEDPLSRLAELQGAREALAMAVDAAGLPRRLWPRSCGSDAASGGGATPEAGPHAAGGALEPAGAAARSSTMSIANPILVGGAVHGVIALFGDSRCDDEGARDFIASVAARIGEALVQRRISLELGAGALLAGASTLDEADAGLLGALSSAGGRPQRGGGEVDSLYEALYESLPVGVSIHDTAGALRALNPRLLALGASVLEPAVERSPEDDAMLSRLYREELPSWVARVLATGEPIFDVEFDLDLGLMGAGRKRHWLCNLAPIHSRTGELRGASVVVQDISPQKLAEAALREADRQKDDFLALLGHELRNPMAAIRNATELLGRLEKPTPELLRLKSIFDRQTAQTAKLIDGLLDVARVARGKVEVRLAPLELVELVRQAVGDRSRQFDGRQLRLLLPQAELWVEADRVRLIQVFDNLISNALKFTPLQGCISIELTSTAARARLRIEDDGDGIEPDLLPYIFEPFRQGGSTRQGLGLGLALVKGLCDLHGFGLTAQSNGAGRGACFQIEFPLAAAPDSSPPESRVDGRRLELLLVEDNEDVAETLAELLRVEGHRVELAGNAELGLQLLNERRPDVVLSDIGLPGMDGLAFARSVREDPVLSNLRLVALTGFGDAATESRVKAAGFDRCLIKPVQLEDLRRCLARVAVR